MHTNKVRIQPVLRTIKSSTKHATSTKMKKYIFMSNKSKSCETGREDVKENENRD